MARTMARSMAPAPTNGRDQDGRALSPVEPPPASSALGSVVGTKPDVVVRSMVVVVARGTVVVVGPGTVVVVVVTVVVVGGRVVVVVVEVVVVVRRVVVVRLVVVVVGGIVVVVVVGGIVVVVVVGSVGTVVEVVGTVWASAGPGAIIQGATASATTDMARMSRRRRMEAVTEPLLDRFSRSPHECSEYEGIVSRRYWVVG